MPTTFQWIGAGLGVLLMAASAQAGTKGGLYEMNAMINEGHPFASTSQPLAPAILAPAQVMTPIAPPSPTLRYTPPPPPIRTAQAKGEPYRPFGKDTTKDRSHGIYISGGGGANLPGDLESNTGSGTPYNIEFDPGFMAQGAIGIYLGHNFRVEMEAAYRIADYDQASSGGTKVSSDGDLQIITGMVNYYYDFGFGSFTPFLGAGLGLAQIKTTALTIGNVSVIEKDDTEFAYQGIIGISYELSRDWMIGLDGRYLDTTDDDIDATVAVTLNLRLNL